MDRLFDTIDVRDNDFHDYTIPASMEEEFYYLLAEPDRFDWGSTGYYDAHDRFNAVFERYMRG